jgi:cytochrome P450
MHVAMMSQPQQREHPPGPPERGGGLGSRLSYYARFARDPIGFVGRRFDEYGDLYYAPSAGEGLYVLRHPDHIRQVLVDHAADYRKQHSAFGRLSQVLGEGLLTSDGETWRRQRRMINPAFSKGRLAEYAEMMCGEAVRTLCRWQGGGVRDVSTEMIDLTLRAVGRTLFSRDVADETDAVSRAMSAFHATLSTPDVLPRWAPSPLRMRSDRALATLDALLLGIVEERRRVPAGEAPQDLLQMLVEARDEEGDGGRLGDREIRDQLVTLFLAGHETTSHALTWTWYLLSRHPEVEAELHRELFSVLGGRMPRFEDLPQLVYTEQVLKESMRLYPPAYVVARRAVSDTRIGDYDVRSGAEVVIWIYWAHRQPEIYPDPEAFRPERFAPGEEAKRPKLSYLPFGGGARACIGKMFAMIEAQIMIAALAQRYRLRLAPGHRVVPQTRITLLPKYGMKMHIEPRPLTA